jgi:polygalacturonase
MLTNFPNGITSFGVPVTGPTPISVPNGNGKVIYVAADGQVGPPGAGVEISTRSIQAAVDACTSGTGDTILVFPGTYDENVTIDGKDYITIIGCQIGGYERPDVGSATGSALTITNSQGVVIRHMRFFNEDNSDVVFIDGNGFVFDDCVFDGNGTMTSNKACLALNASDTDNSYTASEGVVSNSLLRGSGALGLRFESGATPASGVGPTHNVISGCRFISITGADLKSVDGGTATYTFQDNLITGCQFMDFNKALYIKLDAKAADRGLISGNFFASDTALDATSIDLSGTSIAFAGNFASAGIVDGTAFNA